MSEMVVLYCGRNDFTTGPHTLRAAVAYIVEAVEEGMDCVGTHEVREPESVPVAVTKAERPAGLPYGPGTTVPDLDPEEESPIEWLRSRLQ